jgi:hypothetical protein
MEQFYRRIFNKFGACRLSPVLLVCVYVTISWRVFTSSMYWVIRISLFVTSVIFAFSTFSGMLVVITNFCPRAWFMLVSIRLSRLCCDV